MSVFSSGVLPRGVSCSTAQELMRALLLRLADDQLGRLQEGENLLKVCGVCGWGQLGWWWAAMVAVTMSDDGQTWWYAVGELLSGQRW
jgi:hypothetical protein